MALENPFNSILDQPIEGRTSSETVVVDEGVGARGDDLEPYLMRLDMAASSFSGSILPVLAVPHAATRKNGFNPRRYRGR